MPIYEYVCQKCGNKFERWSNKVRDSDWVEICPKDGGSGKRVISPCTFHLKGTGWYQTDYGNKSKEAKPKEGE